MINIALFGVPGAGKGTQSKLLSEKLGLIHISTGEIIRREIEAGTDCGKKAEEIIARGELLADEIIFNMFENELKRLMNPAGFLFDGFPRTVKQAELLNEHLSMLNLKLNTLIELLISEEESLRRLMKRAEIEGRIDDDPEVIRERFRQYKSKTAPIADYYKKKNLYIGIDGLRSIEDINQEIIENINKFLKN
jgi:adenylate kinase